MTVNQNKERKRFFPLKEGYFLPITNDRIFRIFCRDKNNRRFLAKIINFITGIDYNLLVDKMIILDSVILEDRVNNHYNEQDVLIKFSSTSINMEMSTNMYTNKRKNEMTAFKYAGNQHKIGERYEDTIYYFYQICFETYNLFNNNLLINEVNLVNVSTGKHEIETKEFKKFHVNLSDTNGVCYNSEEEEKYFKFFTLEKIEDLKQISEGDEILMEAFKSLEKLNNDSILMSLLEEQELNEYCQRAAMVEQKQLGFDEGKNVGFDEGLINGKKREKFEIAKKLINLKVPINTIIEATGLTKEELEHLN